MAKVAYYTVSTSFVGSLDGGGIEYHKGEIIDGDDPALKRWPEYFEPLVVREHLRDGKKEAAVEQATAAPGEKRTVAKEETPAGKAITTSSFKGR